MIKTNNFNKQSQKMIISRNPYHNDSDILADELLQFK